MAALSQMRSSTGTRGVDLTLLELPVAVDDIMWSSALGVLPMAISVVFSRPDMMSTELDSPSSKKREGGTRIQTRTERKRGSKRKTKTRERYNT